MPTEDQIEAARTKVRNMLHAADHGKEDPARSQDHAPTSGSVTSGQSHTPLGDLELVCGDIFERWDKDMRAGKLLTALSGHMSPGYDARVDRVRAMLAAGPALLEALKYCLREHGGFTIAGECERQARAALSLAQPYEAEVVEGRDHG